MSSFQEAINQIRTARMYANDLLKHVDVADWFRQPSEGITHVAWQVGHLATAQYSLALKRVRGENDDDDALISQEFRRIFGFGSTPTPDATAYPKIEEIREVFDRVHDQALKELNSLPAETADQPVGGSPHPMFKTKLGALQWCAQHEFIHVGQIALLRRLFGAAPLR